MINLGFYSHINIDKCTYNNIELIKYAKQESSNVCTRCMRASTRASQGYISCVIELPLFVHFDACSDELQCGFVGNFDVTTTKYHMFITHII